MLRYAETPARIFHSENRYPRPCLRAGLRPNHTPGDTAVFLLQSVHTRRTPRSPATVRSGSSPQSATVHPKTIRPSRRTPVRNGVPNQFPYRFRNGRLASYQSPDRNERYKLSFIIFKNKRTATPAVRNRYSDAASRARPAPYTDFPNRDFPASAGTESNPVRKRSRKRRPGRNCIPLRRPRSRITANADT